MQDLESMSVSELRAELEVAKNERQQAMEINPSPDSAQSRASAMIRGRTGKIIRLISTTNDGTENEQKQALIELIKMNREFATELRRGIEEAN